MNSPLLVVVLMVKNEAHAMENTLLPFINGGAKHFAILDTGSTDATIEITKKLFEAHNVHGFVNEEPFVDFSTSRNRALAFAEAHFPQASFFIMVDADWYIQNVPELLKFCEAEKSKTVPLYNILVKLNEIRYYSARLMRVSAQNRYVGVVHETPENPTTFNVPEHVYLNHTITNVNKRKSESRYQRDEALLFARFEKNPTESRTLFYLAQTYECLQDYKNAYKYYLKRSRLTVWAEEDSVASYRLGTIAEQLSLVEEEYTWAMAMEHYVKAFTLRPGRIEPLVRIASHYCKANPQIAAVYMKYACAVPYPKDDMLFVIKEMYDYTRYEILSICAWYIGEFELGKEASEMALRISPNSDMLKTNLKIYTDHLATLNPQPAFIAPAIRMSQMSALQ